MKFCMQTVLMVFEEFWLLLFSFFMLRCLKLSDGSRQLQKLTFKQRNYLENFYLKFISGGLYYYDCVWAGARGACLGSVVLGAPKWRGAVSQLHPACVTAGEHGGEKWWHAQKWLALPYYTVQRENPCSACFWRCLWSLTGFSLHCFPEASGHHREEKRSSSESVLPQSWRYFSPAAAIGRVAMGKL